MTDHPVNTSLADTPPVVLEIAEHDEALEPPEQWDPGAHDDADVREGVEITDGEET